LIEKNITSVSHIGLCIKDNLDPQHSMTQSECREISWNVSSGWTDPSFVV